MGLDNGFILRGVKRTEIPSFVVLPFDGGSRDDEVEIVYWRKCWGLRNMITQVLHMDKDTYEAKVEAEDLRAILRKMPQFFDKTYWEDEGDSIWTFEEAFENILLQQTINLYWLESYLSEHPDKECYFYDSY